MIEIQQQEGAMDIKDLMAIGMFYEMMKEEEEEEEERERLFDDIYSDSDSFMQSDYEETDDDDSDDYICESYFSEAVYEEKEDNDAWRQNFQEIYEVDPEDSFFKDEEEFNEAVEDKKEELVVRYCNIFEELDEDEVSDAVELHNNEDDLFYFLYYLREEKENEETISEEDTSWKKKYSITYEIDPYSEKYRTEESYLNEVWNQKENISYVLSRVMPDVPAEYIKRCVYLNSSFEDLNPMRIEADYLKELSAEMDAHFDKKREDVSIVEREPGSYIFYSVEFGSRRKAYSYIADEEYFVGDKVIVPVGENSEEKAGIVVSKTVYALEDVPYPIEKTKKIKGKI